MSKHVIIISEDALVYEDIDILKKLPNFSRIFPKCARVNKVRSVYPSLTYVCHTTMMTGVYPDKHGIINNETAVPGMLESPWNHFRNDVKVDTMFDYAHRAGLKTANVFWPVTGCDPSIDYLIDEYWPQTPDESTIECFRASGSSEDIIENVIKPHLSIHRNRSHPYSDVFMHETAIEMILRYKPNLLTIHPANIDGARHECGVFSEGMINSLHLVDLWFGQVLNACEEAGILEDTNFFIVSDHGHLNIVRSIALNTILAEEGFITVDKEGKFIDYKAYVKSAGLSAHVYLKDPDDTATYSELFDLLTTLQKKEVYGISRVYTKEDVAKEERLTGDFSFVLESDGYTSFSNAWCGPLVRPLDSSNYRMGHSTHGHLPHKGPQPTFLAFGPDIKAGKVLEHAHLTDLAPTFAYAMGLEMKDCDGRVLKEIFK